MASLTHGREFEHTPGDAEGWASLVGHDQETEQQADWTNMCSIYPGLREKTQVGGVVWEAFPEFLMYHLSSTSYWGIDISCCARKNL